MVQVVNRHLIVQWPKSLRERVLDLWWSRNEELYDQFHKAHRKNEVRMLKALNKENGPLLTRWFNEAIRWFKLKPTTLRHVGQGRYEIRRSNRDGVIYCTCPGWAFHKQCKHLARFWAKQAQV